MFPFSIHICKQIKWLGIFDFKSTNISYYFKQILGHLAAIGITKYVSYLCELKHEIDNERIEKHLLTGCRINRFI